MKNIRAIPTAALTIKLITAEANLFSIPHASLPVIYSILFPDHVIYSYILEPFFCRTGRAAS